jgi:ABC-2 type transport system ATP-binding protein
MNHKPTLSISHLEKKVGKAHLLHDISLTIEKGEVFWFLGPNGAGKTTTMKCILGIMRPTTWEVKILGWNIDDVKIREKIGFMPENTYLYKYLTGDEFLDFNARFYGLSGELLQKRKDEVLEKVGLTHARGKRLHTYSKWMLQRIGLAQAILHDPELIFLDEPMSGLDPVGRKMVKDLMLDLKKKWKTLFFNTHILSDVEAICDRFAIIAKGRIVADMRVRNLEMPIEDFFMERVTKAHGGDMRVE